MPALRRLLDARAASWGRAAWALPARAGAACRTGSGRCAGRLWAPLGDARSAAGRWAWRCLMRCIPRHGLLNCLPIRYRLL